MKRNLIVNIAVFFELIWLPLTLSFLKIDGAGRIPFVMLLFALFYSNSYKYLSIFPIKIYFIWVVYAFVNTIIVGSNYFDTAFILFTSIASPFIVLLLTIRSASFNLNALINTLILSLYVYCFLGIVSGTDFSDRMSGGVVDSNSIGARSAFIIFLSLIQYYKGNFSLIKTLLISIPPFSLVFLTGSRTSFGILSIVLYFFIVSQNSKNTIKNLVLKSSLFLMLVIGFNYVLYNTEIGERLMSTTTQIENTARETGTILDYLGDRGFQYYESWFIFKDHKVSGIGLGNYVSHSKYNLVLHSDYLIHFCELGLIGTFLYLLYQFGLIRRLLRFRYFNKQLFILLIGGMVSIYFLSLFTRASYYSFYFGIYGLIFYFSSVEKKIILPVNVNRKVQGL